MRRGTSNRNQRGNSRDRAARKTWLIKMFGLECFWCLKKLTRRTMEIDRVKPGRDGGRYVRNNIVPCCAPCNKLSPKKKIEKSEQAIARGLIMMMRKILP